jgi:hypothetical protein
MISPPARIEETARARLGASAAGEGARSFYQRKSIVTH